MCSCISCNWEVSFLLSHDFLWFFALRLRQLAVLLELSSFRPFRAYVGSEYPGEPFPSKTILLAIEFVLDEIQQNSFWYVLQRPVFIDQILWNPAASPAIHAMDRFVLPPIVYLYFGFRFLLVYAAGVPVAPHSYFHFFRLLYLLTSNTESCDEDDDVRCGRCRRTRR